MREKLTCYIIDDEHLAQEILEEYIAKVPFLELKGSFMSPLEASSQLKKDNPDLLFLDINMPDLDGLNFIPMLHPRPLIILTTAYDQYALQAFELNVKDYLVKPFSFERFYKGVLRLFQEQSSKQQPSETAVEPAYINEQEYLFLKVGHRIQKIATSDICFIQGMKDYLQIRTAKEKILTLTSFAKLEEHLPAHNFARVHKSYMVAIDKIDHIEKNRIWIADQIVPISGTYSDRFFRKLKGL
ncbi:LytR/AlgR family response regulator transcription factor [Pontibacter harenae]|uniref:LytR/AlgR family response regulator transcription factor n=1 Tax=Pontibacter harenae TaxID=2894083 RepID=UPI001E332090|nr:LytTR family DNA-binding domain-containing protein [Pontibacter harenae]MCC9168005.1 LytTR family DNA-binding domain-containing protein [Pontibacter harenae]